MSVGSPAFCAPPADERRVVGAVGVFTVNSRSELRAAHRRSWLAAPPSQPHLLAARFVARGRGDGGSDPRDDASITLLTREARRFGDIIFLDENASLARHVGPLFTLVAWFECAARVWPNALFVGKADDDVWIDLAGVAAHLHSVQAALRELHASPRIYWGLMEGFSWLTDAKQPVGWSYGYRVHSPGPRCSYAQVPRDGNETGTHEKAGPFWFAKGPLFFLSSSLVRELLEAGMRTTVEDFLTSPKYRRQTQHPPWEDAFTGFMLATAAHAETKVRARRQSAFVREHPQDSMQHPHRGSGLFAVHLGRAAFAEAWGAYLQERFLRDTVVVFHDNFKWPERIDVIHLWSKIHRCRALTPSTLQLTCDQSASTRYISCTNASWTRCAVSEQSYTTVGCQPGKSHTRWVEEGCVLAPNRSAQLRSVCKDAWRNYPTADAFYARWGLETGKPARR